MWNNDPISTIDAENIEKNVSESYKAMHKAIKQFQEFESNYKTFRLIKLKKKKLTKKLELKTNSEILTNILLLIIT
jgi:hypothetical protein